LEHGDRIRLGDSIFLFLLHEGEPPLLSGEVKLSDEEPQHDSTILLRREEALYLDSARVQAALPQESRMARHLNALLGISAVINAAKNIETLEQQWLELIAAVVPAQCGAIMHAADDTQAFTSVYTWDRQHGVGGEVTVSRTIAQRVLREGVAILSNDAPASETISLVSSGTRSLLAVPLTVMERRLGVLWLATSDPVIRFDEAHLQLT